MRHARSVAYPHLLMKGGILPEKHERLGFSCAGAQATSLAAHTREAVATPRKQRPGCLCPSGFDEMRKTLTPSFLKGVFFSSMSKNCVCAIYQVYIAYVKFSLCTAYRVALEVQMAQMFRHDSLL